MRIAQSLTLTIHTRTRWSVFDTPLSLDQDRSRLTFGRRSAKATYTSAPLGAFAQKVAHHAFMVNDDDIRELRIAPTTRTINPTNLRVRIWRKLQKLGAVAIKNSVYVLPATEKAHEDFQWLKQEIESAGGEASVFKAASVEGATDQEIIAAFRKARDEEFAAIAAEFDGLTGQFANSLAANTCPPADYRRTKVRSTDYTVS